MALAGSSVFALLVMSVWWKRINQWGAMAALITGSLAALTQILLSLNGSAPMVFGVSGAVASILAVPLSTAVALAVSLLTPVPELRSVELVRDLRVPGGETVHDREIRLARIPARTPS
jgi:cation/acetate symporter